MLRIFTVIGARPQFVKAAVLSRLIRSEEYRGKVSEFLLHTGQHYDENMSSVFFREMGIPEADVNLGIGGGSHGKMTGAMLAGIEALLMEERPDLALVYGDTNSTLAAALAASKLHVRWPTWRRAAKLQYGHAGGNQPVLAEPRIGLAVCPTLAAVANLRNEGIPKALRPGRTSRVYNVGDVMLDASLLYRGIAENRPAETRARERLRLPEDFVLTTIHRAENTDDPAKLRSIIGAINEMEERTFVFPIHPRTRKVLRESGIELKGNIVAIDPVGYLDMLELEAGCGMVVTDSGGVQKEASSSASPASRFARRPSGRRRPNQDGTSWRERAASPSWPRSGASRRRRREVPPSATGKRAGISLRNYWRDDEAILVVSPHTDDGELGCGGFISRLVAERKEVFYVAFSAAERSVPKGLPSDLPKEVYDATAVLGIRNECVSVLKYDVRVSATEGRTSSTICCNSRRISGPIRRSCPRPSTSIGP